MKNNYFPIRVNEQRNKLENRKTEITNTILELCNKHNAIMPLVSEEEVNRIFFRYYLLEDEIVSVNDENFIKQNSFRYALHNRIKSLPTRFNADYILKALNIAKPDKKEIKHYEPLYWD